MELLVQKLKSDTIASQTRGTSHDKTLDAIS